MKIALYSGTQKLCELDGGELPHPKYDRHKAAHEIVDFFKVGEWVWVDGDKRGIRYTSITSLEILPETAKQSVDLTETAS